MRPVFAWILLFGCFGGPTAHGLQWVEFIDGELSNDHANPTALSLDLGDNIVLGSVVDSTNPSGGDVDYFTLNLPPSTRLEAIALEGQTNFGGDIIFFMGIVEGTSFANGNLDTNADDLLGYTLLDESSLFTNLLPRLGTAPGAIGFSGFLDDPPYSVWVQQTGTATEYLLEFKVAPIPEGRSVLLVLALSAMFLVRKCNRGHRSRAIQEGRHCGTGLHRSVSGEYAQCAPEAAGGIAETPPAAPVQGVLPISQCSARKSR